MSMSERVVLISGGCSGIGWATVQRFAEEGASLIIGDINTASFSRLSEYLERLEAKHIFVELDVTKEKSWEKIFEIGLSHFSRIDCVVNNAGIAIPGSIEDASLEDWNRELSVNLTGPFLGTKYAIKNLKRFGGTIVNLSSIEGIVGHPNYIAYCAGKAGVRNLTKSSALYVSKCGYGIRINSVHPGYITTPMIGADPIELEHLRQLHPIGRLGKPKDVANMILFLSSNQSDFITGAEFVVDGGFLAQ